MYIFCFALFVQHHSYCTLRLAAFSGDFPFLREPALCESRPHAHSAPARQRTTVGRISVLIGVVTLTTFGHIRSLGCVVHDGKSADLKKDARLQWRTRSVYVGAFTEVQGHATQDL